MSLKPVYDILQLISETSKSSEKLKIIKQYETNSDFSKVVELCLNIYKRYNVTKLEFIKLDNEFKSKYMTEDHINLWKMLDYLTTKNGATNDDNLWLSKFASYDEYTVDVIKRIINKKLKVGAGLKTFKKVFPNLPDFGVMLCIDDIDKHIKACNTFDNMCWSIKLDGVRVVANNGSYFSRNGLNYNNFSIFDKELERFDKIFKKIVPPYYTDDILKDGEVITTDFQNLMGECRSKEFDNSNFTFNIFDLTIPKIPFSERYKILFNIFKYAAKTKQFKKLKLVEHHICSDYKTNDDLIKLTEQICNSGEEGIVCKNLSSKYEYKRSNNWLKCKKFMYSDEIDLDVIVEDFDFGEGKYSNLVGKLNCYYMIDDKKISFKVGSGFTDMERKDMLDNIPEVIEIKFQGFTNASKPRFPIFVANRIDKDPDDCVDFSESIHYKTIVKKK